MLYFPPLRTARLTLTYQELTIGQSIALAGMPPDAEMAGCTAMLRSVCTVEKGPADPGDWTVQERMFALCHYLAVVSDDGPDFAVGDGRYTDYLDAGRAAVPERSDTFEVQGDAWHAVHLTGAAAEAIERLRGEVEGLNGRLHWLLGGMAAQLRRAGEEAPSPSSAGDAFDQFLVDRMQTFTAFPESAFAQLLAGYHEARFALAHLFDVDFGATGLVAMPKGGADGLPPARFPFASCLTAVARRLGGKPARVG